MLTLASVYVKVAHARVRELETEKEHMQGDLAMALQKTELEVRKMPGSVQPLC